MNLNIKNILAGLVLLTTPVIAQDNPVATDSITYDKTVSFNLGVIQPIALGDNFIANGTDTNLGGRFDVRVHLLEKASLGLRFDAFGYDVTDVVETGLYDRGTVVNLSILGGYDLIEQNNFTVSVLAAYGTTSYNNRVGNERFYERANTFSISGEVTYALNRYFNLYSGLEFRSDKLNIDGAPQIQSQFNNVQYLVIQAGLRIILWNKEGD